MRIHFSSLLQALILPPIIISSQKQGRFWGERNTAKSLKSGVGKEISPTPNALIFAEKCSKLKVLTLHNRAEVLYNFMAIQG